MPRVVSPLVVVVALLAVACFAPAAHAHSMVVSATVGPPRPDVVRVEAGYEYGDPADGATVLLIDTKKLEVARGKTDAAGVCVLPRPPAGTYRVVADDGAGHRESVTLTVPASEAEVAAAASTKRNRWVMAAAGLAVIGGLTLLARKVLPVGRVESSRPAVAPDAGLEDSTRPTETQP